LVSNTAAAAKDQPGLGVCQAEAPPPVSQLLARVRETVEPAHRAAIDSLPGELRHIAGYHIGWWDADGRPSDTGGKAIRPALTLASAAAITGSAAAAAGEAGSGYQAAGEGVVLAAVAVELVHDFSLLHDDVMDRDLTRRHRPAAWAAFGITKAILVGDMLLALACDLLAYSPDPKVLSEAVLALCGGQAADLAFEQRDRVPLAECVDMAAGKTGALLGCACELGVITAGGTPQQATALRSFGQHLGLAFQYVDDLLGIWGDPQVTGKPAHSDLASRKKSLPVVAALNAGTPEATELGRLYGREHDEDPAALVRIAGLIQAVGARDWAKAQADQHLSAALHLLEEVAPAPGAARDLRLLADLITRRDH
jgi:geranylgeranyl diphosphate synthase type I